MNKLPYASRVTALVMALVLVSCDKSAEPGDAAPKSRPAVLVETEVVNIESLTSAAEAVGTLVGNESVTLTAKVTEQVRAVHFEGGELVKAGQILVELIDVEQLALLQEAEANLRESQLQLDRLRTLGKEIATAAEIDVARARVDANAAMLDALQSRIDDRTIKAPFDGIVGFRRVSVGALLTPGTIIAELDDIDPIKLDFTLPEHLLSQVDIGDVVTATSTAWSAQSFTGQISQIGSRIDPLTRAFEARALLTNEDAQLRPGMLMTVSVALGAKEGIAVAETALIQRGGESVVFTIDDNDIAQRVPVTVGRRFPGRIEIKSGLQPGVRVVTTGQLGLRAGSKVRELTPEGA